jgi:anti-sigma B factor antagonist
MATRTPGSPSPATPAPAGGLTIASNGNLVASTVEALRKVVQEALTAPCTSVSLDLRSAEVVDSLGITLILGLFKTCQQKKIPFQVEGVSPDLLRVFKLFSLPRLFTILER